jgi:hypothetical protein
MNTAPPTTVELGLDLSALGGPFLTLDDPIQGQLDDPDWPLSGIFFYDITESVRSVNVNRGKSRQLDRYTAGQANIVLNNNDRAFDPENTLSPFAGQIIPKRTVRITSANNPVFYGNVDDWNLQYELSGLSLATAFCVDDFSLIAQSTLSAHTAVVESTGARINEVLDRAEVRWPASLRQIDNGQAILQADEVELGTNALSYLEKVVDSEPGSLFISKDGQIVFKDRSVAPITSDVPLFTDDETGLKFSQISIDYGSELLFNRVIASRLNGGTVVAEDTDSIALYGQNSLNLSDLLNNDDSQLQEIADYLVGQYKEPEYRFESIGVVLHDLDINDQLIILGLEIGDVVQIKYTPNGVGSQIDKYAAIIRIDHEIQPMQHMVVFGFQTIDTASFVLDSDVFGILDSNVLGF